MLVHLSPHCSTPSPNLRAQLGTPERRAPLVCVTLDRVAQGFVGGAHRAKALLAGWTDNVRMRDANKPAPGRSQQAVELVDLQRGAGVEIE